MDRHLIPNDDAVDAVEGSRGNGLLFSLTSDFPEPYERQVSAVTRSKR